MTMSVSELHDTWNEKMLRVLVLLCALGSPAVFAEDSSVKTEEEGKQQEKTAEVPEDPAQHKDAAPEAFKPTEKVSEDFSVAFPVDI